MVAEDASRGRKIAARRTILAVAIAIVVAAMFTNGELRQLRSRQDAHRDLTRALGQTHDAIVAALDSTDQRVATAQYLLGWFEQTEEASSTGLIESLSVLRTQPEAPAAIEAIDDLVWTGQLISISDRDVRRRLLALQRRLHAASAVGEVELERYRVRLEELLSPGVWRHVFQRESDGYVIDYRGQLRELHTAGFDRTMRSLLRGLDERRTELQYLSAEAHALLAVFDGHDTGTP
ncbi:MAG: hypothetical protein ACREM1_09445 [Longimicrobiales bacterium]